MHRKRSSNSLEQGLVTQQQQTTHPTYSLNIQHSFSGLPKINGSGMCTSRLPFASLIAFLCCLFGVLLFSTMMLWAFNASIEQIRRALQISNLPWLDKVQLLFIISTLVVVVVSLALLCIGVLSTGPTRESVFRKKDAQSGGRLFCIGAVILSSALHFLWTIIATLTAILTFAHSVLFALCSIVGDSSNPNQCLDLSVFGPLTNGQASASLKFCEGQLQEFCAFTNTVVVWYFIGFTGALIVCIGFLQFIGTNTANYARIQSEAKYNELQHIVYAETMGVPMNHFMGRDTLSNDHFMDCSPTQRKQSFGCYPHGSEKHRTEAMLSSARRHSYQHSLQDSSSCRLNGVGGDHELCREYHTDEHFDDNQSQDHSPSKLEII